jgi:quercetin dioxygenase-like cupin family protein
MICIRTPRSNFDDTSKRQQVCLRGLAVDALSCGKRRNRAPVGRTTNETRARLPEAMTYYNDLTKISTRRRGSFASQMVGGQSPMAVWVDVQAGTHTAAHRHPNEQITRLMEGRMEYRIDDGPLTSCGTGTVVHIPANVAHEVWYHEDCRYFEIFSPPRSDFLPAPSSVA